MSITTGKGDGGKSRLIDGTELLKDHPRFEAYGTVDELNSLIGMIRSGPLPATVARELDQVNSLLFSVGSDLATPGSGQAGASRYLPANAAEEVTQWIRAHEETLPPLTNFILPGGSPQAALCHLARTVCRRAERRVVTLERESGDGAAVILFLNRLSDLLFLHARLANAEAGVDDVEWQSPAKKSKK